MLSFFFYVVFTRFFLWLTTEWPQVQLIFIFLSVGSVVLWSKERILKNNSYPRVCSLEMGQQCFLSLQNSLSLCWILSV